LEDGRLSLFWKSSHPSWRSILLIMFNDAGRYLLSTSCCFSGLIGWDSLICEVVKSASFHIEVCCGGKLTLNFS